jgi:membrane-associated HD superfamily phosphohydrolase
MASINTALVAKKIKNFGQTTLVTGLFFAILYLLVGLYIVFNPSQNGLSVDMTMLISIVLGIYWIVAGINIKKHINDVTAALTVTRIVAASSIILSFYWLAALIALGGSVIGIIAVVFTIYAIVAQNNIIKLSKAA